MKKKILLALLVIPCVALSAEHRGRIQIQGSNPVIEKSSSWDTSTPITSEEGIKRLDSLWNSLSASQKKDRLKAYECAKNFIIKAKSTGGSTRISKTCQDPQRKDSRARIDIEVISGKAFN